MTMKKKIFIISGIVVFTLLSCKSESNQHEQVETIEKNEIVRIDPLKELKQVDKILSKIVEAPENLIAPSDKKTIVTGSKGTIIYINPNHLETFDGSTIGDDINIELLEMTDKSSLLFNNAQTVSNGEILETGGAYYLNMTSNGKQLKIKPGEFVEVEFLKLSNHEMSLFLGEKDSIGQINWIPTKENFEVKNISDAKKPKRLKKPIKNKNLKSKVIITSLPPPKYINGKWIFATPKVKKNEVTEEEYQEYLNKKSIYEKQLKQIELQRKTYKTIKIRNFGWINCDRYLSPTPQINIQLLVNNDSLSGARMYAVFKNFNSTICLSYWKGQKGISTFKNIPIGQEIQIIALAAKDESPYIFETTINPTTNTQVKVEFTLTTLEEIKERIKKYN